MKKIVAFQLATVGLFAVATLAMAQDTAPATAPTANSSTPSGGWRRVGDSQAPTDTSNTQISQSAPNAQTAAPNTYPDADNSQAQPQPTYPQSQPPQAGQQPMGPMQQGYPQPPMAPQQQQQYPMQAPQGRYQVPAHITIPAGSYLTVRVNQRLSSDHNQVGDAFSATLVRPVVVDGVVVAEPGQTLGGRVAQVEKAGRVEGLAKLGVEMTDLTLVDGQQLPVKTTFVSRTANSTVGRDAGAIAGTTALGAAVGAAADWGRGAAIGAGAGLVASTIGVLVTRGAPSVIYPEQVLTFKLQEPLSISTERSPQAFRFVEPNEYSNQMSYNQGPGPGSYGAPAPGYGAGYASAPAPYYYGNPYYGYPYYPYGGFSLFVGPSFYGRGFYGPRYYGGFRGGFRR